jgi:uncharacterized membrane protein
MTSKKDTTKFDPNIAAALSYMVSPFTGILFFAIEKEDSFVRFHAFQSILFGILVMGLMSISHNLSFMFLGFIIRPLISLASFYYWVLLMWKAYNHEHYELPYLGNIAKEQAHKK